MATSWWDNYLLGDAGARDLLVAYSPVGLLYGWGASLLGAEDTALTHFAADEWAEQEAERLGLSPEEAEALKEEARKADAGGKLVEQAAKDTADGKGWEAFPSWAKWALGGAAVLVVVGGATWAAWSYHLARKREQLARANAARIAAAAAGA